MYTKKYRIVRFLSYLLVLLLVCAFGRAQETTDLVYYEHDYFTLEGTAIHDTLKENRYDRLPLSYKTLVRKPVWELSKASAGLSIRFRTNSTRINLKWTVLNNVTMNHMAETGIKGVDLYFKNKGTWQYLNTARPTGVENEALLVEHMTGEMREYKMYLPLYDGLDQIEVGIDANSQIEKPEPAAHKPIVFYGTSITQGGCASRPGMVHTNIIARKLNIDCINFGFSGNGRMEQALSDLIAEIDAAFYVIECLPNMTAQQVTDRTLPLVKTIREKRPETPIVFVDNFLGESAALDQKQNERTRKKNAALKAEYAKIISAGYQNIFLIDSKNATGFDHEGTVDGIHFTDLGFMRYADFLMNAFYEFALLTEEKK